MTVSTDATVRTAPICVVGMHRSGTSMVTGVLEAAGVHLGPTSEILGAEESNPEGHFENKHVIDINEAILDVLGGSWDEPPERPDGWLEMPPIRALADRAREVMDSLAIREPWGWKDPRTTILLPFWRSVVPDIRFVVCVRSPLEVARSLRKRDELSLREGSELWTEYTLESIRGTAGCSRMIVLYDEFLRDPEASIRRLGAFCGLRGPVDREKVESRVVTRLRHHVALEEDLVRDDQVRPAAKFLYLGIVALMRRSKRTPGPIEESTGAALDALAREIDDLAEARGEEPSGPGVLARPRSALDRIVRRIAEIGGGIHPGVLFEAAGRRSTPAPADRLETVRSGPVDTTAAPERPTPDPRARLSPPPLFPAPVRRHGKGPEGSRSAPPPSPRVSIVVRTCVGRLGCLGEALDSIVKQSHANLEIVVVEDGSGDARPLLDSVEIPPHMSIVYQEMPKVGRCVAGNRGLAISQGEYVGFLDDDDRMYENHVSTLVAALEERPEIVAAYSVAERVKTRVESYSPFVYEEEPPDIELRYPFDRGHLWIRNLFPIQAVLFRRSLFERYGGFCPELDRLEDWDLWVRYSSRHDFVFVDRVTSMYRVPGDLDADEERKAQHDLFFTRLRELQGRVPVRIDINGFSSLVRARVADSKTGQVAQRLGCVDSEVELKRHESVRSLFRADRLDATGSVETTPREVLSLARQVILANRRLGLLYRASESIRRNTWLKRLADRCYAKLEQFL